jgi:hypothetical protein
MTTLARAALLLTLVLAAGPVLAQTGGTPVETLPVPLPPDKQTIVREHARREKMPEARVDGPVTVGATIPEAVELWGLPEDSVIDVPTVTSYKFLLTGKTIAVVDPESRKVIQIIPN